MVLPADRQRHGVRRDDGRHGPAPRAAGDPNAQNRLELPKWSVCAVKPAVSRRAQTRALPTRAAAGRRASASETCAAAARVAYTPGPEYELVTITHTVT